MQPSNVSRPSFGFAIKIGSSVGADSKGAPSANIMPGFLVAREERCQADLSGLV
jgi:hypothetical protein